MSKYRTRSVQKKAKKAEKILKLPYKAIGSGKTRIVYDLKNGFVVKIAIAKRGLKSNKRESDMYSYCSRRMRRYLCPVVEYADHGWIIMKKIKQNVILTLQDEVTLERLRKRFLRENVIARSLRNKNLARANNRFVVIDYGSFRFNR